MTERTLTERLHWWAYKLCGKGEMENEVSDTMTEAKDEIDRLRAALDAAADTLHDAGCRDAWAAARAALGEKE